MTHSWRSVLAGLLQRTGAWRRQWHQVTSERKAVLVVTRSVRCRASLRVLAIEEGWRILFAESIEDALRLEDIDPICVLIYDHDLPDAGWRDAFKSLLASRHALFPILLSRAASDRLRSDVVSCGGYDVAPSPLDPGYFVPLVNGALALAESIDSIEVGQVSR